MSQNELGVLVSFDQESEEILIKLQNHIFDHGFHGTQTKSLPYHILAKNTSYENREMISKLLLKLEQEFKAFPLTIEKPIITNSSSVLALQCQVNQALIDLLKQLDAPDVITEIILLKDTPELIDEAYHILQTEFKPFVATVSKLHLYIIEPTQQLLTVSLV